MMGRGGFANLSDPGYINQLYNYLFYPAAGMLGLQATRRVLRDSLGVKDSFTLTYVNEQGEACETAPINLHNALQQSALFAGACGIFTFGNALNVAAIRATGILFMISNGFNLAEIASPVSVKLKADAKAALQAFSDPYAPKPSPEEFSSLIERCGRAAGIVSDTSQQARPFKTEELKNTLKTILSVFKGIVPAQQPAISRN
jgi:hypothetical protein